MMEEKSTSMGFLTNNALHSTFRDLYTTFSEKRDALGLSNPGTVENISREVQRDVFLTNSMFTGLRADITKVFSAAPMFQTSHAFATGSQGIPPYTFLATYGSPKACQILPNESKPFTTDQIVGFFTWHHRQRSTTTMSVKL